MQKARIQQYINLTKVSWFYAMSKLKLVLGMHRRGSMGQRIHVVILLSEHLDTSRGHLTKQITYLSVQLGVQRLSHLQRRRQTQDVSVISIMCCVPLSQSMVAVWLVAR
jgi:hypothetical protein